MSARLEKRAALVGLNAEIEHAVVEGAWSEDEALAHSMLNADKRRTHLRSVYDFCANLVLWDKVLAGYEGRPGGRPESWYAEARFISYVCRVCGERIVDAEEAKNVDAAITLHRATHLPPRREPDAA